ncbi:MAG: FAD-dependent oxidoreductase, partial [Chitinophagaceae bacterium]
GWVSNTQFEPHVADSILKQMAGKEKNLRVIYGYALASVEVKDGVVTGATFREISSCKTISVEAKQTIDATELGDVMKMAGVPYNLGMESAQLTGETVGVTETNDIVQDLTYVAILKDYGAGRDCTIVKPSGYDPKEFDGSNTNYYFDTTRKKPNVDAKKMLDYGRLPNNKYMLNWPIYGNDIYLNIVEMSPAQRALELEKAKQTTMRFVYFIQHELGFKHLGLTDDEFPTADRMALMPYHREGRRLKGVIRYNMEQIAKPFEQNLYRTGISVGDYPIDHHHKKNLRAPQQLEFYPVPSFNIPLGTLIPEKMDGLIVAEKGISVSNVANGTTRLQPVVMLTGQSTGMLAAIAARNGVPARKVAVRNVQSALLSIGAYLMPYNDVKPTHPQFSSIQKVGATGILKGVPSPFQWANRTWFYPDSTIKADVFLRDIKSYYPTAVMPEGIGEVKISDALGLVRYLKGETSKASFSALQKTADRAITRAELAQLIDDCLDPFSLEIDHSGKLSESTK